MKIVIQRALKAFHDIDHLRKTRRLQSIASVERTLAAAANDQHRALQIATQQALYLGGEFRVDLPIRRFLPGHMLGPDRMANIHMLDFGTTIDKNSLRMGLQEGMGGAGIKVLHRFIRRFGKFDIMKASPMRRKLKPCQFAQMPEYA